MSITQQAETILTKVQAAGAQGDLIIDHGDALSLKAQDGELEEHKVTSSQIFGLRVIKDDRVGTAYSEAADPDALSSLVEQALINASYAAPEIQEKILVNSNELSTDDNLLCPEEQVAIEQKIDLALKLEAGLKAKDNVKNVPYNGVQDGTGERHIYSTAGLHAASKSRMCSAFAYALIEDGDKNALEGVGQAARLFAAIDPEKLIEEAYRKTLDILEGTTVPSAHYDVIFDEETQPSLFGVFSMMFSGKSAKDGVNPMRDKLGQVIADPRLTVFDQPENTNGFRYTLFDDEGTPAEKLALISAGTLGTLIHNSMTAAHFDTNTTGHATRGPRSTLGVGLHQPEIAPGDASSKELHGGKYLLLTNLTGLHSGANPISGDFSFGASGYLCRDGGRIQPVRGITVAGNFYDMLKKIQLIGSTQHWNWQRSSLMPAIRFADVAISG